MNQTKALKNQAFDPDKWQKLYYRNQKQYIRRRLEAIQLLHQGNSRTEVGERVGCSYDTLTNWVHKYLQGGLKALVSPIRHQKPSRLTLFATTTTQRNDPDSTSNGLWHRTADVDRGDSLTSHRATFRGTVERLSYL